MVAHHYSLIFDLIRRPHALPTRPSPPSSLSSPSHGSRAPTACTHGDNPQHAAPSLRHLFDRSLLSPALLVLQLGNLCPDDSEEAKALIPSLQMPDRDIDTSALTDLLGSIASYRSLN